MHLVTADAVTRRKDIKVRTAPSLFCFGDPETPFTPETSGRACAFNDSLQCQLELEMWQGAAYLQRLRQESEQGSLMRSPSASVFHDPMKGSSSVAGTPSSHESSGGAPGPSTSMGPVRSLLCSFFSAFSFSLCVRMLVCVCVFRFWRLLKIHTVQPAPRTPSRQSHPSPDGQRGVSLPFFPCFLALSYFFLTCLFSH